MKPPYELNSQILSFVSSVSEKLGRLDASFLVQSSPTLRKQNRIKTIHSSLQIEGNTLSEEQISAILESKRVIGPSKDIQEVQNAIEVYHSLSEFQFDSLQSYLRANRLLMNGLIEKPGTFREQNVGIVKGSKVEHLAPPAANVRHLMKDLFSYLKKDDEIILIKSCVFHYEMEFIHPFIDGNGRMGRLWQTVILMSKYPIFQHIPFESLISESQEEYYKVLSLCDKTGKSTLFIEYMLRILDAALEKLLGSSVSIQLSQDERLEHFCSIQKSSFSRKDYMLVFNQLSSASASRDLKAGIEMGLFRKTGDKSLSVYDVIR